MDDDVNLFMKW